MKSNNLYKYEDILSALSTFKDATEDYKAALQESANHGASSWNKKPFFIKLFLTITNKKSATLKKAIYANLRKNSLDWSDEIVLVVYNRVAINILTPIERLNRDCYLTNEEAELIEMTRPYWLAKHEETSKNNN
ncbi:hypothetical protein [Photobacterium kishitanii]|nr:hypothetical protein [Photobacterium kishitanii]